MSKFIVATVATLAMATSANALTLIRADVTGPTGTIWTTAPTGNYTLFLQNPGLGDFLNPNGEAVSLDIPDRSVTQVLLAGEGFTPGTNADSDPIYNLTLSFDNGLTLLGSYTPVTNTFNGGTSLTDHGQTYSLIEFSYRRFLGDAVQPYSATPGGDGNDYIGNFNVSAFNAVPEPASWAMMLGGFAMLGAVTRRRTRTTVTCG